MGSEPVHRLTSIGELRRLLVPSADSSRWDEGELARAVLHLDDQAVLLGCTELLGLAVVGRRSIDGTPESKAHALRAILAGLLPKDFDHPYCFVLRCPAGLEQGTAGRKREQRQEIAGKALGPDGYAIHPRSVRRRVRQDCWSWLFDRLMGEEVEAREALDAERRGSQLGARAPSPAPGRNPSAPLCRVVTDHLVHPSDASAMGDPFCAAGCFGQPGSSATPASDLASLQEWLGSSATEWLASMGPVLWIPVPECGDRFGLSWPSSGSAPSPALPSSPEGSRLDPTMKRRTLVVGLPATWLLARSGTIPALSHRPATGSVTEDALDRLAAAVRADILVAELSTQATQESCAEHARVAIELLRHSPAALRPRAAAIASEATAHVAYVRNDQGQTAAALSYYRLAAELAHESEDPQLEAFVLANWSDRLADEAGEPDAALPMLDHAGRVAAQRNAPATLQHLALVEAETHARLGNADASLRALDRADRAHDRSNGAGESRWLQWLDEDIAAYWKGESLTYCGRLDDADALFSEALGNWRSPARYRSRALVYVARLRLRQGEVDEACRAAEESLDLAVAASSPRTVRQIRDLRRDLQPWNGASSVRSLDERMAAVSGA